jgi:transcriptional regulator with XRE-family HTH domain
VSRQRTPVHNSLSRLLAERGWSDGQLAARAGLPRMRVNRIKNRRARPRVGDALVLAGAFGVAVTDVFRLADPKPGMEEPS